MPGAVPLSDVDPVLAQRVDLHVQIRGHLRADVVQVGDIRGAGEVLVEVRLIHDQVVTARLLERHPDVLALQQLPRSRLERLDLRLERLHREAGPVTPGKVLLGRPQLCDLALHPLMGPRRRDTHQLERGLGHDHQVPVLSRRAGHPSLSLRRSEPGRNRQHPRRGIPLGCFARDLVDEVIGHDQPRFGRPARAAQLHRAHHHRAGLPGADDVVQQGGRRVEHPRHALTLVGVRRERLGQARQLERRPQRAEVGLDHLIERAIPLRLHPSPQALVLHHPPAELGRELFALVARGRSLRPVQHHPLVLVAVPDLHRLLVHHRFEQLRRTAVLRPEAEAHLRRERRQRGMVDLPAVSGLGERRLNAEPLASEPRIVRGIEHVHPRHEVDLLDRDPLRLHLLQRGHIPREPLIARGSGLRRLQLVPHRPRQVQRRRLQLTGGRILERGTSQPVSGLVLVHPEQLRDSGDLHALVLVHRDRDRLIDGRRTALLPAGGDDVLLEDLRLPRRLGVLVKDFQAQHRAQTGIGAQRNQVGLLLLDHRELGDRRLLPLCALLLARSLRLTLGAIHPFGQSAAPLPLEGADLLLDRGRSGPTPADREAVDRPIRLDVVVVGRVQPSTRLLPIRHRRRRR